MKILPKGANAPLANAGSVRVDLRWKESGGSLDAVCFAVADDGRVPSDDWFLFYNQTQAPDGVIRILSASAGRAEFIMQLERLPAHIQRCVFAATLENGLFRDLTGATLTATPDAGPALGFTLTEAGEEQALIFAEIYRHGDAWKFRAIGQGFRGGLQPLAEHFGVAVETAPPRLDSGTQPPATGTPPPVPDQDRVGADSPRPPTPPDRPRRSGGLSKALALVILLLVGGVGGVWYFYPSLLENPGELWRDSQKLIHGLPAAYQPPNCDWTDEQVFERYHTLGESYVKILQRVDNGNRLLSSLRFDLVNSEIGCPPTFLDKNRLEIAQLEKLPVDEWMDEAVRLNLCAGLMIKEIELSLNEESRPIIIQRLVHEADRSRNLESDLTNISRDLAYLRNKTDRLIAGFKENLDACP